MENKYTLKRRISTISFVISDGLCLKNILFLVLIFSMMSCVENMIKPVSETGTISDNEGNIYKTVKIGSQWWMAENLRVTSFNNGDEIPVITGNDEWHLTDAPACSYYVNNINASTGLLYNFYTVKDVKDIAPEGWRIPTDEDWKALEEYIGMPLNELDQTNWRGSSEGDKLKEVTTNTTGWVFYDTVWGTDDVGFDATGGSCRVFNGEWGVPGLRHSGYWWSSSENNDHGWFRYLDYKKSGIFRYAAHPNYGFSVRCVKE